MIKIFDAAEQLNQFAAEKFVEIARASINSERGNFTVALSGGSTPKSLYRLLASDEFKDKVDWSKVFFFFGDERNVSPDDEASNFRMANENLFAPLKISGENIVRWRTETKDAEKIAEDYAAAIKKIFDIDKNKFPVFDLILLGMGDDGHTASLFPFTPALNEKEKTAVANQVEKLNATRLTLTFPVINQARNVVFLIKGADKAETLRAILEGDFQPEKYPAQAVKPVAGELFWLIDGAAARRLK